VTGLVLDAYGKPFEGLKLAFYTIPSTISVTETSDVHGTY
jgi:hypothetical protein